MTNDILDLLQGDWLPAGTVSGGDLPGMESVSGGDASGGGINYYQVNLYTLPEDPVLEVSESQEIQYTLWDKPLEEYTVTEGLLLILVLIAVAVLAWSMIKGGFKWLT